MLHQRIRYILRASQGLRKLRDSEERFRALVRSAGSVILVFDPQGRVLEFNPAAEKLYPFRQGEPAGADFMDLLPRFHDRPRLESSLSGESALRAPDGSEHILLWNVSRFTNVEGVTAGWVVVGQDITPRRRADERIRFLAYYDHLTRLPNRVLLQERLRDTIESARRRARSLAVLFLDLDQFKRINDSLGHRAGDVLLQEVAVRLQDCLRTADYVCPASSDPSLPRDLLARLGGDEFVVLLAEADDADAARTVAQRILTAIARPFMIENKEVFTTCSIGVALYPRDGADMDTLLKNADVALYHAKNEGRNNHQFYSDALHATAVQDVAMESMLRKALAREEMTLHYQPQVDISNGRIVGVEALLRWRNPALGDVAPADFIPLAEETGLIAPIGEWVLQTACNQARIWRELGLPPLRMAVNLSPRQFVDTHLTALVTQILRETGLRPEWLELEITENLLVKEGVIDILRELKRLGVRLALDDFGMGNSNLGYLRRFPIDSIKIDKSFVREITGQNDERTIAAAVIAMARGLRLEVIAEGVETETQLAFLRAVRCEKMQGFLFGRPYPAEHITQLLRDYHSNDRQDPIKSCHYNQKSSV